MPPALQSRVTVTTSAALPVASTIVTVIRLAPGASGIALLFQASRSAGQSHTAKTSPRVPLVSLVQNIENVPGWQVTVGWVGVPPVRTEPELRL